MFKDNLKHKKIEWPDIWNRCANSNLISKGSSSQRYLGMKISKADEFLKIASRTDEEIEASRRQIIVLTEPSITPKVNVMEADTTPNEHEWATKIIQFLRNGLLPEDKVAARMVKIQATRFCLIGEVLYKRGYSEPLLNL
jgi:hypothetical protein